MYTIIPYIKDGEKYVFNRYFGFVYSFNYNNLNHGHKIHDNNIIDYVRNPFLLKKRNRNDIPEISSFIRHYAHVLLFLWKYCYPLIFLISNVRLSTYDDAGTANLVFRKIFEYRNQRTLCLPRSIFIATTSKRFKKHGAMFIGCFFPSRHMHAWVIEDGMQADIYDNQWTQFTPLAIMK